MLLLHGFPDSSYLWRRQIPALAGAGFRSIAPDLRGFGASDRPPHVRDYRLSLVLRDVEALLDSLGVERAHVVGHDWGAAVAWLFAARHPERVERLVVLSVGHPAAFSQPSLAQLRRSWYIGVFQLPGLAEWALRAGDWRALRRGLRGGDVERYVADLSRPGALTAALNLYRANPLLPVRSRGGVPVSAPTLGVWGARDPALTERQMIDSGRYVRGPWRYERFDDAGHWLQLQRPERLNALLLEFLG